MFLTPPNPEWWDGAPGEQVQSDGVGTTLRLAKGEMVDGMQSKPLNTHTLTLALQPGRRAGKQVQSYRKGVALCSPNAGMVDGTIIHPLP